MQPAIVVRDHGGGADNPHPRLTFFHQDMALRIRPAAAAGQVELLAAVMAGIKERIAADPIPTPAALPSAVRCVATAG